MINFEEELKKFHPSLEVEDVEDAIYHQDLTDIAGKDDTRFRGERTEI